MSARETTPAPTCPSCGAVSRGPLVDADDYVCFLCPTAACDRVFVVVMLPEDAASANYGPAEPLT